jgi:hypothetical protein
VAVFGGGPVGLMAAYSAIIRGASLVYVVDHVPARLAKAAGMGAIPINFTRGGSASQQILRLRPRGVNRVVDAVGMGSLNAELKPQQDYVILEAIAITRGLGGIGIAGAYPGETPTDPAPGWENIRANIPFPIGALHFKELRLQGGIVRYYDIIPALVALIRNGRARPGFLFTDEMDLEDAPRAYKRFEAREEVKILLKTGTKGDEEEEYHRGSRERGERELVTRPATVSPQTCKLLCNTELTLDSNIGHLMAFTKAKMLMRTMRRDIQGVMIVVKGQVSVGSGIGYHGYGKQHQVRFFLFSFFFLWPGISLEFQKMASCMLRPPCSIGTLTHDHSNLLVPRHACS